MDPRSPPAPPAPPAPSARQACGLKRRLLERVAEAEDRLRTVAAQAGGWQPYLPGVQIKVLHERAGVLSYLLRLAPGASLPAHRHPRDEECLVLDGQLQVGRQLEVGPGDYHLAPKGALHATISSLDGATIFLRGAIPEPGHALV